MKKMKEVFALKFALKFALMSALMFALTLPRIAHAQLPPTPDLEQFLSAVDLHNPRLKALRLDLEAGKLENRTGLNPPDPRVGVTYLRPNPRMKNQLVDLHISQEFEFPTVYGLRRKAARQQNTGLEADYELQRREILHEAVQAWLEWIYLQRHCDLLARQQQHASSIAVAYQRAFETGQISVLERNKARVHAANAKKNVEFKEIEVQSARDRLIALNGGQPLSFLDEDSRTASFPAGSFPVWSFPDDLEQYLARIAVSWPVKALESEVEVARIQEKVAGAMQLPSLDVGFLREQDIEVDFRGVSLGVSVPLWQHRNQRRHARRNTAVREHLLEDGKRALELEQRALFRKAQALKTQLDELRTVTADSKDPALLRRALDLGELTLVEYLVEQGMYYELQEAALQAEWEYLVTLAEMRKWTGDF